MNLLLLQFVVYTIDSYLRRFQTQTFAEADTQLDGILI
jgi:hypothetical protein